MKDLVDKLIDLQGARRQQEFADELGVDQSVLSRFLRRQTMLGPVMAKAIVKRFPHLKEDVSAILFGGDMLAANGTEPSDCDPAEVSV